MSFFETVRTQAAADPQRVAIAEGADEAMMRAAAQAAEEGFARPILVGDRSELESLCEERGIDVGLFDFADTADDALKAEVAARCAAAPGCILPEKSLLANLSDELYFTVALAAADRADVAFAGISSTTGDVIMAAQILIGLADGVETPSSVGFYDVSGFPSLETDVLALGDPAVCVNPSASELAGIAVSCCETFEALCGIPARCAMLSHSTLGSADNALSQKVVTATEAARALRPDFAIDGEFQLDTALLQNVASRKVLRESAVAGRANVIVCPDIDVGNITAKAIQVFGLCPSAGPFLQGFGKVVADCSRGATVEQLVDNIAVCCVRAQARSSKEA
jgi:phosphotransacetylase